MENTQNIFLLPTDKISNLYEFGGQYHLNKSPEKNIRSQYIYITENTVVKEGDYGLAFAHGIRGIGRKRYVFKHDGSATSKLTAISEGCQKIILTNDIDLINDGIQPIEDNFIEWFVSKAKDSGKPIDIIELLPLRKSSGFYDEKEVWHWDFLGYKILIPEEETTPVLGVDYEYSINNEGMCVAIPIIKNETLQESAENYYENNVFCDGITEFEKQITLNSFQAGGEYLAQKVTDFLNEEITERRDYSASKMCEVVREFIENQIKEQ